MPAVSTFARPFAAAQHVHAHQGQRFGQKRTYVVGAGELSAAVLANCLCAFDLLGGITLVSAQTAAAARMMRIGAHTSAETE